MKLTTLKNPSKKTKLIYTLILGMGLLFVTSFVLVIFALNRPTGDGLSIKLVIEEGDTFNQLIPKLKKENYIRSTLFSKIIVKMYYPSLKKGVYTINNSMSTNEILGSLNRGIGDLDVYTIPEGSSILDIVNTLQNRDKTEMAIEFAKATVNPILLNRYQIPNTTAEGYLFPSTYHLSPNDGGEVLAENMMKKFFELRQKLFKNLYPEAEQQLIVLASIVEKEAVQDDERTKIARVFLNRLKKEMKLESCATVIYIFEQEGIIKNRLYYKDLKKNSPYNTYLFKGLPPAPIANSGLKSLQAVIDPPEHDYLYFVHKGNGHHYFAKTLAEHIKAYEKYIKYQNMRKK